MQSLYCPTKVYIRLTFTLMMAVRQTPLSRFATQCPCECGTIIYCSVAVIPLSAHIAAFLPCSPWALWVSTFSRWTCSMPNAGQRRACCAGLSSTLLLSCAENPNGRLAGVAGFEPANMGVKVPCLRPLGDTPVCRLMQRRPAEPTCNLDQSRPRSSKRHFRLKHDLMVPYLHLVTLMMDDLSGEFPFRLFTPKLRYRLYPPDDTAARCGGFIPTTFYRVTTSYVGGHGAKRLIRVIITAFSPHWP